MEYEKYIEDAKNERMEQAVSVASELFLKKSIDEIKMTDIAKESKIGVASLYRYFGTKTQIVIKSGALIWNNMQLLFDGVFESDYYRDKTGIEQISELLKVFYVLYTAHKDFLKFVHEFDNFILKENVEKDELAEYESSIMNSFPLFEKAFLKGCKDNTVNPDINVKDVYFTITHALITLCQKFNSGSILKSDNFEYGEKEINMLILMAINYIKK